MRKLRLIILMSLISLASSCITPMPTFKPKTLCTIFISAQEIACFCADYDMNQVKTISEFKSSPLSMCHKMHGFPLEQFKQEFEPTMSEIQQWDNDIRKKVSNAKKHKKYKFFRKLAR